MKVSLPVFVGSLTTTVIYTGFSLATTAAKTTTNIALTITDSVLGLVGGSWVQIPFRTIRGIAQPAAEASVQLATLGASMVAGAVLGSSVYIGEKVYSKLHKKIKIESLQENAETGTSDILLK